MQGPLCQDVTEQQEDEGKRQMQKRAVQHRTQSHVKYEKRAS